MDTSGTIRKRVRKLPQNEWAVLLRDHHPGFIDGETYEANRRRLAQNTRPRPHEGGGAVREGAALLQGLATCGHCGRRLRTHYRGRHSTPGYHCAGKQVVNGRGVYCLNIGGVQIDTAVVEAFLAALNPAGLQAVVMAAEQLEADHDAALAQWRLAVERARYEAEPAEAELARREQQRPRTLSPQERERLQTLGADLGRVWSAPTTTERDRKELLRTLLEEVIIAVKQEAASAHLTLRWKGGLITELDIHLPRSNPPPIRTAEDTIDLVRRLAVHYPDAVIAGILNRQGRKSARGERFTAGHVSNLRRYWKIPCFKPPAEPTQGEPVTIREAAQILDVAPSTLHRWLNDGFIAGEQITPGAPWRIRITDELKALFVEEAPAGYLPMLEATKRLGVSRQTVLQRVKRGELEAVHVRRGKRKGLRIRVIDIVPDLFDPLP